MNGSKVQTARPAERLKYRFNLEIIELTFRQRGLHYHWERLYQCQKLAVNDNHARVKKRQGGI